MDGNYEKKGKKKFARKKKSVGCFIPLNLSFPQPPTLRCFCCFRGLNQLLLSQTEWTLRILLGRYLVWMAAKP